MAAEMQSDKGSVTLSVKNNWTEPIFHHATCGGEFQVFEGGSRIIYHHPDTLRFDPGGEGSLDLTLEGKTVCWGPDGFF